MATRLRPIAHDDRLSVVDHLDELRSRLMTCAIALAIAFAVCLWQKDPLIDFLNEPLRTAKVENECGKTGLSNAAITDRCLGENLRRIARPLDRVADAGTLGTAADRANIQAAADGLRSAAADLPRSPPTGQPITTGVAEPFTVTLTVSLYFALLFALPVLLYQAYAFLLPAFSPQEKRVALPLMLGAPLLFLAGVAFAYFLILKPALTFLQNFNDQNFDILLQAKDYYRFCVLTLLALGLAFQVPIGMLVLSRLGIVSRKLLTQNWRYAIVAIAVLAALLPGVDPVTTGILMVPLLGLYGISIVLVGVSERRRKRADDELEALFSDTDSDDDLPPDDDRDAT